MALVLVGCSGLNPAYDGGEDGDGSMTGGAGDGSTATVGTPDATTRDAADGEGADERTSGGDPMCGNGVREGDEECDDGINDGSYDGCMADCQRAPHCGDGIIDAAFGEMCDDENDDPADGCLAECLVPTSCLEIREVAGAADDGVYIIDPVGNLFEPFEAYCDMTTDGGGYTFFKVSLQSSVFAPGAEDVCGELGMQLWIPRTLEHRDSGWDVANEVGFGPRGSGGTFVGIMGVYPLFPGATCPSQPLTSDNPECEMRAGDDLGYWVDDRGLFDEPNGNDGNSSPEGSLEYLWSEQGDLNWYDDRPGDGGWAADFMCDVGDKY